MCSLSFFLGGGLFILLFWCVYYFIKGFFLCVCLFMCALLASKSHQQRSRQQITCARLTEKYPFFLSCLQRLLGSTVENSYVATRISVYFYCLNYQKKNRLGQHPSLSYEVINFGVDGLFFHTYIIIYFFLSYGISNERNKSHRNLRSSRRDYLAVATSRQCAFVVNGH